MISPSGQWLISIAVVGGGYVIIAVVETIRPLRRSVEDRMRRIVRNLTVGGISLAIMTLLQTPLLVPAAEWGQRHHLGLLRLVALPPLLNTIAAIVLLDYTLWWWHLATHKIPFLWRFHLPHHVDLDLDASTALRFHFGELTLSIAYRAAQIVLIGVDTYTVWIWHTILFASILFHHSNIRLPIRFERWLVRLIATPRMHGIHHSDRENETNSNWSSLLSCWDYLHRTILLTVAQESITIGVPAYHDPKEVTIGKVLTMPFRRMRDAWRSSDAT
jgi:sterol desaturase/sphingolipid hydroxylase (fatty acid hydroxylase superfamily)